MPTREPFRFSLDVRDFDLALLPPDARVLDTERCKQAIKEHYAEEYGHLGGTLSVDVDDENIEVAWAPRERDRGLFERALQQIQSGKLREAVPLLEALLAVDPEDVDVLYNLGMALSDLNRLEDAKRHLQRAVEHEPDHVNALVALGVAYQRERDSQAARRYLEQAVLREPGNGYAQRNLGAVLGNLGEQEQAEEHLRTAYRIMPDDQATVYGLARCVHELGGPERLAEADALYIQTIALDPDSQITELARRARGQIAATNFREVSNAPRMDAVMYCLSALERFESLPRTEVQAIVFEIALLGRRGLDVNDSTPKYRLRSVSGRFSGLQLVAMMYVGFKQIAPQHDAGFDLSREYAAALELYQAKPPGT